jgi:hypothetical protein
MEWLSFCFCYTPKQVERLWRYFDNPAKRMIRGIASHHGAYCVSGIVGDFFMPVTCLDGFWRTFKVIGCLVDKRFPYYAGRRSEVVFDAPSLPSGHGESMAWVGVDVKDYFTLIYF